MLCGDEKRLVLQFHITGRCNLRCKHCYREEGNVEPLTLADIEHVISQFRELVLHWQKSHGTHRRGHINITGGEPFIRQDIGKILTLLGENRDVMSYGVLSNGSFLNGQTVQLLKDTGASFVQLSIDGDRATHDALRAPGDHDRVFRTARYLEKQGISTYISFTANRQNYRQLPQVAARCRHYGITKLWSDRLVPIGNGQELKEMAITREVLPDYLKTLKRTRGNWLSRLLYPKTQVTMNRALQFLQSGGAVYSCGAGITLITVDEFGTVLPCRRMPIPCGNVFDQTLKEIYYQNEIFRQLRQRRIPEECAACPHGAACRGGAKCQAYADSGQLWKPDPGCYLQKGFVQETQNQ